MQKIFLTILSFLKRFLWPSYCFTCVREIAEEGGIFCSECYVQLHYINPPFCYLCGHPIESLLQSSNKLNQICASCIAHTPSWRIARAPFAYDGLIKKIILSFKYADRPYYAATLAYFMAPCIKSIFNDNTIFIAVPLHVSRLKKRYYNQSCLLAKEVSKILGGDYIADALIRVKKTQSLKAMSIEERYQEMRSSIKVSSLYIEKLKQKRIILIDDVLTTGATADACVHALNRIGCVDVSVLAAARVVLCKS